MFALFGPRIPSWKEVLECLPDEYKSEAELFDASKTGDDAIESGSKINRLLTQRTLFFSRGGYVTKDAGGTFYRVWARLHYDETNKPNGIILCMMSQGHFNAWKSQSLCAKRESVQSFSWVKEPSPKFTFKEKGEDFLPHLFKTILLRDQETESSQVISCDIEAISPDEIKNVQNFCGTADLPLPPRLYEAVYPKTPLQKALPYIAVVGVVAIIFFCINRPKAST